MFLPVYVGRLDHEHLSHSGAVNTNLTYSIDPGGCFIFKPSPDRRSGMNDPVAAPASRRLPVDTAIFGLGFAGDLVLAIYGGAARNGFFLYSSLAAMGATGLMTLPGILRFRLGPERAKALETTLRWLAGPLHNSAGLAMIGSGLGWGGTGRTALEMAMGVLSTSGSVTQFYGEWLFSRLDFSCGRWLARLGAGQGGRPSSIFASCRRWSPMPCAFDLSICSSALALYLLSIALLASKRGTHDAVAAAPEAERVPL